MLSRAFMDAVEPLYNPGLGTEHVAGLLYSIVRMTRPRSLLEIGLGYTTPFLLQAMRDNIEEHAEDLRRLQRGEPDDPRLEVLRVEAYKRDYAPTVLAVDDLSDSDTTATEVPRVIAALGLDHLYTLHQGSFRRLTPTLVPPVVPFDFVWFDCGGPREYVDFLTEYWPHIQPHGGILLLHYTYWHMPTVRNRRAGSPLTPGPLEPSLMLREIKRQQGRLGLDARFEVASLVEPHKTRQGSVTLIRRLAETPPNGDCDMAAELEAGGFPGPYARFTL
ncbi:MAG: class I SAM-dependent methyltransferase [Methylocella sp.]